MNQKERSRTYYLANKEAISQRAKVYYQKHKEEVKSRVKDRYYSMTPTERYELYLRSREYNHKHALSARLSRKAWENEHPSWAMYHNAKRRARDMNVPFDIHWSDIEVIDTCPVFGTPLIQAAGPNGGSSEDSPSLDRVVPELGYVKGNIRVISSRANRMKSNSSPDDLRKLLRYIEDHVSGTTAPE